MLATAVLESTEVESSGLVSIELSMTALASTELATAGLVVSAALLSDDAEPPPTKATPYSSLSRLIFAAEDPQFVITPFEAQSQ